MMTGRQRSVRFVALSLASFWLFGCGSTFSGLWPSAEPTAPASEPSQPSAAAQEGSARWFNAVQAGLVSGQSGSDISKSSFLRVTRLCQPFAAELKSEQHREEHSEEHSEHDTVQCDLFLGISASKEVAVFTPSNFRGVSLGRLSVQPRHIAVDGKAQSLLVAERNVIHRFSLPGLELLETLQRIPSDIQALDVSGSDDVALVGAADGRVYRWSWNIKAHPSQRQQGRFDLERYFSHANVVSAVLFHPAGRVFFSGDWSGRIIAWKGYEQDPYGGAFDENIFGTGFFSDLTASQPVKGSLGARIESLSINSEGNYLYAAYDSGDIDIWKLRGVKRILRVKHHRGAVVLFAPSPTGIRLLSYGRDQRLVVSEVEEKLNPALGEMEYETKIIFEDRIPDLQAVTFLSEERVLVATEASLSVIDILSQLRAKEAQGVSTKS